MSDNKELYQRLLDSGEWMDGFMPPSGRDLARCEELCFELNSLRPSLRDEREACRRAIYDSQPFQV